MNVDEFHAVLIVLLNGPVILLALVYLRQVVRAYRHHKDHSEQRALVTAVMTVAGALAMTVASATIAFGDVAFALSVLSVLLNASRVMLLGGLVVLIFVARESPPRLRTARRWHRRKPRAKP